jgi:hypothetical protein
LAEKLMMAKLKNIIIFVVIAVVLFAIYYYVIRQPSDQANLVSTPGGSTLPDLGGAPTVNQEAVPDLSSIGAQDFLALLLSVRNIKLDDSIFSDPAFASLHDSTIVLVPDGTEGRPNPFAPFGQDATPTPPAPATVDNTGAPPTN